MKIPKQEVNRKIAEIIGEDWCYATFQGHQIYEDDGKYPIVFDTDPAASWRLLEKALIKMTVSMQHDHPGVEIVDLYDNVSGEWLGHGVGKTFADALNLAYLDAHNISVE